MLYLTQGANENEFLIEDEDDLKVLAEKCLTLGTAGITFKQTDNLDFEGATWTPIGAGANKDNASWKDTERENPVGGAEGIANRVSTYKSTAFKGTFDGQDHTISNVVLPRQDYTGVFGSTYGATIKNLKVSCSGFEAGSTDCGGAIIAGTTVDTTIENCEVSGTVTATKAIAGIVGYGASGTIVKGCVNKATLTTANEKIGGMIACAQNGGNDMDGNCVWGAKGVVVDGCTNEGNLSCTTSGKTYVAGLVSYADSVVTLKGANVVTGTLSQTGGSVSSIAAPNSGSIVLDGATFTVPAAYKTTVKSGKAVDGMIFATVENGVATCVANSALAVGGSYKVMATGGAPVIELKKDETITFDQTLATIDASGITTTEKGYEVTKEGNTYKVTLKTFNITYVYKTNDVAVAAAELTGLVNNNAKTFTVEDVVTITGITLEGFETTSITPEGWAAGEKTADVEVTVLFTKKSGGWNPGADPTTPASDVPGLPDELKVVSLKQISTWATGAGKGTGTDPVDPADVTVEAFLLNCENTDAAIAEAKANFKFTAFDPTNPPTAEDFAVAGFNGTVSILKCSDAACTTEWTDGDGQAFYKAVLAPTPVQPK